MIEKYLVKRVTKARPWLRIRGSKHIVVFAKNLKEARLKAIKRVGSLKNTQTLNIKQVTEEDIEQLELLTEYFRTQNDH